MSILIKGMEMPTSCASCPCGDDESRFCRAANEYIPMLGRPKFCPLVPVPPHGRLIDADALRDRWIWGDTDRLGYTECVEVIDIDNTPTIIEAEVDDG